MLNIAHPGGTARIDADPHDHIGKHYAKGHWYEPDLLNDARQRLHGPGTAVDVGAHVGGHSLWFALTMGIDVIALEPNPETYARLTNSINASNANVKAIQAAAGAEPGHGTVKPPAPGNSGTAGVIPGEGSVDIITLDSLDLENVKLVKIDVEGMAGAVLDGAQRLLTEQAPILYVEGDRDEIQKHLPAGYRCVGKFCWTPTYLFVKTEQTKMRLSASIMAHPARTEHVQELQAALDRDVPVAWDPNPDPSPDPARRWATGKAAWELHDPTADWHMVIQDDAIVCRDLLAGLETALAEIGPDGLASAYTGTGRPNQAAVKRALADAAKTGHTWMYTWSLNWGVAIIAPTRTIPAMIEWCDAPDRAHLNYDMRVGQYYRDVLGWRTWYTVPSLVDHRDTASLIGHGQGGNRRAHTLHDGSALDIDWTRHDGLPIDVSPKARRRH